MERSWFLHRRNVGSVALVVALSGSVGASCGSEGATPTSTISALPLQASNRFPVGATFYLPTPKEGRWVLDTAPAGNENAVVAGNDGFFRFTPVVVGD